MARKRVQEESAAASHVTTVMKTRAEKQEIVTVGRPLLLVHVNTEQSTSTLKEAALCRALVSTQVSYLKALMVVRPSAVSEKWQSRGSWVESSRS